MKLEKPPVYREIKFKPNKVDSFALLFVLSRIKQWLTPTWHCLTLFYFNSTVDTEVKSTINLKIITNEEFDVQQTAE